VGPVADRGRANVEVGNRALATQLGSRKKRVGSCGRKGYEMEDSRHIADHMDHDCTYPRRRPCQSVDFGDLVIAFVLDPECHAAARSPCRVQDLARFPFSAGHVVNEIHDADVPDTILEEQGNLESVLHELGGDAPRPSLLACPSATLTWSPCQEAETASTCVSHFVQAIDVDVCDDGPHLPSFDAALANA
jgi:hypothetical protein